MNIEVNHVANRVYILASLALLQTLALAQEAKPPLDVLTTPENPTTLTTHKFTNRLINETSPYLLQHAHNPVDWYPWGDEALEKARRENKPIFLSIGYSACHWCHVMEHESFENEAVAAILNEHFVSIKVDREERPDLDEIYMTAVQIMTGSGGWPMTVFLTPELKPFYGGTYFPPVDMYNRPGFGTLLRSIHDAWINRREAIDSSAKELGDFVARAVVAETGDASHLKLDIVTAAARELAGTFDPKYGGFGQAPKFPSGPSIEILLREYRRSGDEKLLHCANFTLRKMYEGGMYDHLGGGFHRYSVDAQWLVPHFEKMLYDNGQLAQAYLEAYQLTKDPLYKRVVEEIFTYVLRDMTDPLGAFHSAENADSEGEEGKFYVWTHAEMTKALPASDVALFTQYYSILPNGNFSSPEHYHDGKNILHITRTPEAIAKEAGIGVDELEKRVAAMRETLLAIRGTRIRPSLDDKILVCWNGLMISAFAKGYQVLGDPRYLEAAQRAANFVLTTMRKDGTLLRSYRAGDARIPAYLDDYAFFIGSLVDLYEASFDMRWLEEANTLSVAMIANFWDVDAGGFFFTTPDHAHLIVRTKPTYDGAEPSGNSMAALALLRLGRLTDNQEFVAKATKILELNAEPMSRQPRGYMKMIAGIELLLDNPREIVVAGNSGSADTQALLGAVRGEFLPNKVVALLDPSWNNVDAVEKALPLLQGKRPANGQAAAYVCMNYACKAPVTTVQALRTELGLDSAKK